MNDALQQLYMRREVTLEEALRSGIRGVPPGRGRAHARRLNRAIGAGAPIPRPPRP
jgi:hypothetical protein